MTTDRVVRVIIRRTDPIIGLIRMDNCYYVKDGKLVKQRSGSPSDREELIDIYMVGSSS